MKKTLLSVALAISAVLAAPAAFATGPGELPVGYVNSSSYSDGMAGTGASLFGTGVALVGAHNSTSNNSGASAWVNPGHHAVSVGTLTFTQSDSQSAVGAIRFGNTAVIADAGGVSGGTAGAFVIAPLGLGGHHYHH